MTVRHLLPPYRGHAETALADAVAAQFPVAHPNRTLWNPATCPLELLPFLAWTLSVDEWDHRWPEATRRAVVAASVAMHRRKGTVGAVRQALEHVGAELSIEEWWQTGGAPHTFRLTAFAEDLSRAGIEFGPDWYAQIARVVDQVKPLRSHYALSIGQQRRHSATLRSALLKQTRQTREAEPRARDLSQTPQIGAMTAKHVAARSHRTLDPQARGIAGAPATSMSSHALTRGRSTHRPSLRRRTPISGVPPGDLAALNRDIYLKRIQQQFSYEWVPLLPVPYARALYPEMIPAGIPFQGPPYSSTRSIGYAIGQDISVGTFLSAAANPDSQLYTRDMYEIATHGWSIKGAVCSNFVFAAKGYFVTPTTTILNREWFNWGFKAELLSFTVDDVDPADFVITIGGGHVEVVFEVNAHQVVTLDQAHRGARPRYWTHAGFLQHCADRGYRLLKTDFEGFDLNYTPDPFVPLFDEPVNPGLIGHDLGIDMGSGANYTVGDTVRFNIMRPDVLGLVITRDGVRIHQIAATGSQIISRSFSQPGHYRAWCDLPGGGRTHEVTFRVAQIGGVSSAREVARGQPLTVWFWADHCIPAVLTLEDVRRNSVSPGIVHHLTPAEIAAGRVTISHDRRDDYRIRLWGRNAYGNVRNAPADAMTLTVT